MHKLGIFFSGVATFVVTCSFAMAAPPEPYQRIVTLESKRSLGNGALAQYLASPDADVAARAALAIGRTKIGRGEALLTPHLGDPRPAVRAMAVYAVGLLATGGQTPALIRALDDHSGAVRVAALDAVARYAAANRLDGPDRRATEAGLERLLGTDPSAIVRARAAVALVEFRQGEGAAQAAQALTTALRDPEIEVRRHAMWAIYRGFARSAGAAVVTGALGDPDEVVRIEAARALGRFQDPALIAAIRPLLGDPSWRVQEQAAETLRVLQGQKPSDSWTAIPSYVHLPALQPDPLASPATAPHAPAKPSAPRPDDVVAGPPLDPSTASDITSPAPGMHPRVRIVTTKGNLYVTLFPEWAPMTVANFLKLAREGYYDGNRWFRIVPDFVVQTGDPNDNGNGDAGYALGAEENPLEQRSYVISMGLNYDDKTQLPIRDSAGTQYYITLSPQYHLDRDFTVFGSLSAGSDVLAHLIQSDRVLRVERIADEKL
jgi:peptidyl-prolyl cis-trans isomerase B (cyclophilin B)